MKRKRSCYGDQRAPRVARPPTVLDRGQTAVRGDCRRTFSAPYAGCTTKPSTIYPLIALTRGMSGLASGPCSVSFFTFVRCAL
jgi:hypothetical protein